MKQLFIISGICSFLLSPCYSQFYFASPRFYETRFHIQAGLLMGGMNCFTDIGGNSGAGSHFLKDFYLPTTRYCFGVLVAVDYVHKLAVQVSVNNGNIEASDAHIKKDASLSQYRLKRNLHFKTNILEALLMTTVYPFEYFFPDQYTRFSPSFSAGIGCFYFNPLARWNAYWVPLHSLHTEGLGLISGTRQYKRAQLNIPLATGWRYEWPQGSCLQLDVTYRKLFTDYLDDVSTTYANPLLFQEKLPAPRAAMAIAMADRRLNNIAANNWEPGVQRGNQQQNDSYFSITLALKMTINSSKRQ